MKLINERSQAKTVYKKWAMQYRSTTDADKLATTLKLQKLDGETATSAQIAEIIGNNSWCSPTTCGECGKKHDAVVEIGEESDYESHTAYLCLSCLKTAVQLLERR